MPSSVVHLVSSHHITDPKYHQVSYWRDYFLIFILFFFVSLLPAFLIPALILLLVVDMQPGMETLYRLLGPLVSGVSSVRGEASGDAKAPPGCTGMLKDVLMNQHRTMFYTATLTPLQPEVKPTPPTANLKWKCACTLTSTQSVMERTKNNSPNYYQLTFIEEGGPGGAARGSEEKSRGGHRGKEYSPVKIYIKS